MPAQRVERSGMLREPLVEAVGRIVPLERIGGGLQQIVNDATARGGSSGAAAKRALQGRWLGHPLHPVLTDVPIGAWTTGLVLDAAGMERGADLATALGLAGAVAAAAAGLADYADSHGEQLRVGSAHAILNMAATFTYTLSLAARLSRRRTGGIMLAVAGYALAGVSSYLGGELAYSLAGDSGAQAKSEAG